MTYDVEIVILDDRTLDYEEEAFDRIPAYKTELSIYINGIYNPFLNVRGADLMKGFAAIPTTVTSLNLSWPPWIVVFNWDTSSELRAKRGASLQWLLQASRQM